MIATLLLSGSLSGCIYQSATGPSKKAISRAGSGASEQAFKVVELNEATLNRVVAMDRKTPFAEAFPDGSPVGMVAGRGDMLSITIWEAPPAALFGGMSATGLVPTNAPAGGVTLPDQIVSLGGLVTVPYVGEVRAAGRSGPDIARDIVTRLSGKAHEPQAMVRIIRNGTSMATVVGDVGNSVQLPLTPRGERVLDALTQAGGVKQAVGKISLQLTRGQTVRTMPLATILADPRQNVMLQPGDVITALYQPFSFTVLGATGRNAEVPFESTGLTLDQALGRSGGLVGERADPQGVFVFRMEEPAAMADGANPAAGKVPVVYHLNLKDPGSFFLMQGFAMRTKDVIYVSNSSNANTQQALSMISQFLQSAAAATIILP